MMLMILILFCLNVAAIDVPSAVPENKKTDVVVDLGSSVLFQSLGNPYPLGGFSGFEVGLVHRNLQFKSLREYGGSERSELQQVLIAKGLYYDVDVNLSFSILSGASEQIINSVNGGARWTFFQMSQLPIFFATQVGASSTSFANKINIASQGVDLVASYQPWSAMGVSATVGQVRMAGVFTGSTNPATTVQNRHGLGLFTKLFGFDLGLDGSYVLAWNWAAKVSYRF